MQGRRGHHIWVRPDRNIRVRLGQRNKRHLGLYTQDLQGHRTQVRLVLRNKNLRALWILCSCRCRLRYRQ